MEILNLFRVGILFGLVFWALPLFASRLGDKWKNDWQQLSGIVFIRTALFFQIVVPVLSQWRLCLPGIMAALYIGWLLVNAGLSYRFRWMYHASEWKARWAGILGRMEGQSGRRQARSGSLSPQTAISLILIAFICLQTASFPIANLRFLTQDSYTRALSIETLLQGHSWSYEGSIPMLVPIAFWSGLDAATVIRLSGPVLLLALLLASWRCLLVFGGSWRSAFFAISLFWMSSRWFQLMPGEENAKQDLAALFLLMAISHVRSSIGYAACSLLLVAMVNPSLDAGFLCLLISLLVGLAMDKFLKAIPVQMARPASGLLLLGVGLPAVIGAGPRVAAEPLQYESAARAVYEIAAQFPRNQWSIISPGNELAQIYGRGWHVQLSDFTRLHSVERVSRPDFEFAYPTEHIFVFVEKRPLPVKAMAVTSKGDEAAYNYGTKSGRSSIEYVAADLMSAYVRSHKNVSVFGEDDDLVVYHIQPKQRH